MFVHRAGVVGAGRIGSQLAQLIAAAGIPVVLRDADPAALEAARERIRELTAAGLDALVSRQSLTRAQADAELERTLALIATSTSYDGFGDVDLAIEAVPERLELKRAVFAELDAATGGQAILASATAAFSIGDLADATARPERVLGLHFFDPLAATRAVEIVEGLETSQDSIATAAAFVATLRKTAIRSVEAPGFIINRVLLAAAGELWRLAERENLNPQAIDQAITTAKAAAAGPFSLPQRLGAETTTALLDRLQEAYGDRFHPPPPARAAQASDEIEAFDVIDRYELRAFVECCLLLEEGVASAREIDAGMVAGAGLRPPLAAADARGLRETLTRLERASQEWGEAFAPPLIVRRLVAQGRLGAAAGQGFFPLPRPDAAGEDGPLKRESRDEVVIAWLDNPPANSITLELIAGLERLWAAVEQEERVRVLVIASANSGLFSAGADIKAFATMDTHAQGEFIERMQAVMAAMERSSIVTIAAVNGLAYGGGCELAMAADIRIAARSASFAQPEIKLGIIPGFGGTQRLPRLIGAGRALELNLSGEPIHAIEAWELGLVNRVVEDHELLDSALSWARRLAAQAPVAVAEIKRLTSREDLDAALAAEREAFARVFASADAREGIAAFIERRTARFRGT